MVTDTDPRSLLCIGGIGSTIAGNLVERCLPAWRIAGFLREPARLQSDWSADACLKRADATIPEAVVAAIDAIESEAGEIDAYVHCVGSIFLKPLHLTSFEELQDVMAVNLFSAFHVAHALIPRMMKRRRGSFVFLSSVAGKRGLPSHEAIAAAKGGLESMVRSAAASYAPYGLRFNVIAPGLVDTNLSRGITGSSQGRAIAEKTHPLGRIGRPENIASLIAWLISPDADWVTGQTFGVDGGMSSIQTKVKA